MQEVIRLKRQIDVGCIEEIKRLSATGYSLGAISKALNVSKSTVYYYAKEYCHSMTTFDAGCLDDAEKGYLIGLFVGDGSFNRGLKEQRFFVRFALDAKRDKDIANRLTEVLWKAGKKINLIPWKSNIIAKTCSKELVGFIQGYVSYTREGKTVKLTDKWSRNFKYGFIAGVIDSDGHVHEHLGTEIKTVSLQISQTVGAVLKELVINFDVKLRDAPANSFSKKPRFEIYISSSVMKAHKHQIPSVKIARYLTIPNFVEKP